MKTAIRKIVLKTTGALLIFLLVIYLYTFLHEGGHALIAIMYGGRIDNFVLGFDAHVAHSGTNFTPIGESLSASAGALLPAVCLTVALIFYNQKVKNFIYHSIYFFMSIAITGSFLAWIAIPLISLFTAPPAGDDVGKFLQVSGLNPLLVSFIALLIILLFVLLSYKKGVYSKFIEYLKALSQAEGTRLNKWRAISFILIIALTGAFGFAFFQEMFPNKIFETSFSMNVQDNQKAIKMAFEVKKNKTYKLNLSLAAEGMLTDIQIFDDKGSIVYQNLSEWMSLNSSLDLKAGNHLFVITFIRDPEVMVQHFKENEYTFSQNQIDMYKELLAKKLNDKSIPVSFSAVIQ